MAPALTSSRSASSIHVLPDAELDRFAVGVEVLDREQRDLACPRALDDLTVGEEPSGSLADRLRLGAVAVDHAGPVLDAEDDHVGGADAAEDVVVVGPPALRAVELLELGVPDPLDALGADAGRDAVARLAAELGVGLEVLELRGRRTRLVIGGLQPDGVGAGVEVVRCASRSAVVARRNVRAHVDQLRLVDQAGDTARCHRSTRTAGS